MDLRAVEEKGSAGALLRHLIAVEMSMTGGRTADV